MSIGVAGGPSLDAHLLVWLFPLRAMGVAAV